jgi:hypothetical protein
MVANRPPNPAAAVMAPPAAPHPPFATSQPPFIVAPATPPRDDEPGGGQASLYLWKWWRRPWWWWWCRVYGLWACCGLVHERRRRSVGMPFSDELDGEPTGSSDELLPSLLGNLSVEEKKKK